MLDEKRIQEAERNIRAYLKDNLIKRAKAKTSLERAKRFVFEMEKLLK